MSLSNFFDSENIGLRPSLSLLNFFDIRYWNRFFDCTKVELSCSIARWKRWKRTTYVQEYRNSKVLLYWFYIRKVFHTWTSKSSTAFFTVYPFADFVIYLRKQTPTKLAVSAWPIKVESDGLYFVIGLVILLSSLSSK